MKKKSVGLGINSTWLKAKKKLGQIGSVIKHPRIIVSVIAGVIAGVFITRGDKLTTGFGSATVAMGALSLPEWSMVIGIVTALLSLAATVYFKWKNSKMMSDALARGVPVQKIIATERLEY